jgi:hypothetical protein
MDTGSSNNRRGVRGMSGAYGGEEPHRRTRRSAAGLEHSASRWTRNSVKLSSAHCARKAATSGAETSCYAAAVSSADLNQSRRPEAPSPVVECPA